MTQATPPSPSTPLLPHQTNYSGPPSSQTLPVAPTTSNENLVTVSPGSHFPNKQTNHSKTLPAFLLGFSSRDCGLLPPVTSCTLQPIEPRLWRPHLDRLTDHFLHRPFRPSPALLCICGPLLRTRVARGPCLPPLVPRWPTGPKIDLV